MTQTTYAIGRELQLQGRVFTPSGGLWSVPSLGVGQLFGGDALPELLSWEAPFGPISELDLASHYRSILSAS